ncbi:MAG: mechanosensitive ion channel family protein [Micrococcales bacterium]
MNSITASTAQALAGFWNDWHVLIRIVLIILGAVVLRWVLLISVRRLVRTVVSGAKSKVVGALASVTNEVSPLAKLRLVQRTQTMGSVLNNFITWSLLIVAITMVLSELGVAVSALAAGAGLLGAGVGFGAQSLIRDLISGLFVVFEDQYGVGDTVNLGEISGVVEVVGLRATQVRDADGVLWYVRNGEILRVGNLSQGWSRAVIDVALPYSSDFQKAQGILERVAGHLASEPGNPDRVIGLPEVWGVHDLNGDQVVLRVIQQVQAGQSDSYARDLRAKIKLELDAAGLALASSAQTILVQGK